MKEEEILKARCNNCESSYRQYGKLCPWRSISGDYCFGGIEYTKCPACERICLKLEITSYGICKDCLIEKLKCCENCADYDGQDCDADNENYCKCFTGDESDECHWRLKGE